MLIYNPTAGNGRLKAYIPQIVSKLQQTGAKVETKETRRAGDAKRFAVKADTKDWIVVAGGDGTVHEVVNGLAQSPSSPDLSIIPGGTANDYARTLAIPLDWEAASDFPIPGQHFRKCKVDVVQCGKDLFFANFWGIGYASQVSTQMDGNSKRLFGRLAYLLQAIQQVNEIPTFDVYLRWKTGRYKGPAQLILILKGQSIGGVRLLEKQTHISDGQMGVLVMTQVSLMQLKAFLEARWTDQIPQDDGFFFFQTDHLTVSASPEQIVDCDGEQGGVTPADISVVPQHLQIILPNQA